jgi:hypothetical protein
LVRHCCEQILAMLLNVRTSGDEFTSVLVDVMDTLDSNLDGKITVTEFMSHAMRNSMLVSCLERAFAIRVPMSVTALAPPA